MLYVHPQMLIPSIPEFDFSLESSDRDAAISKFTAEAKQCFDDIAKSEASVSEKYKCLGRLRNSITSLNEQCSLKTEDTELSRLTTKIVEVRKEFRRDFTTDSHWLVATTNGRHLQSIRPSLRKTPKVKLSLNSIRETLNNIASLKKGIDRIRALHHFNKMALDTLAEIEKKLINLNEQEESREKENLNKQRDYLVNAIDQITKFGDISLTFEEKISLLFQIEEWDRDPIQTVQLKSLVDRYGRDFALHFMKKEGMTLELLFDSLKILLREVHENKPGLSLLSIVKNWPLTINSHEITIKGLNIRTLLAMYDDLKISKDPVASVVHEYLLNFLDGSGELRLEELNNLHKKKQIKSGTFYKEVGRLCCSLRRFDLNYRHIFAKFAQSKASSKDCTTFKDAIELMSKKIGGSNVVSDLKQLARTLQFQIYSLFQEVVEDDEFNETEKIEILTAKHAEVLQKLRAFVFHQVVQFHGDEQTRLIANFMHLGVQMVNLGNYDAATAIMASLECFRTSDDDEHQKSWQRYKALKCYAKDFTFLDTLFSAASHFKNYRTHKAELEHKGMLCIPITGLLGNDLDKFNQAQYLNRDSVQSKLEEILSEEEREKICKLVFLEDQGLKFNEILTEIEKFMKVVDSNQAGLPPEKTAEIKKELKWYIEAKMENDEGKNNASNQMLALCFAIKIWFLNNPSQGISRDFLDMISSQAANVTQD